MGGCAADDRLRDFTVSLGDVYMWCSGSAVSSVGVSWFWPGWSVAMADSGSMKAICNASSRSVPSTLLMSVEEIGVGGKIVGGIVASAAKGRLEETSMMAGWNCDIEG